MPRVPPPREIIIAEHSTLLLNYVVYPMLITQSNAFERTERRISHFYLTIGDMGILFQKVLIYGLNWNFGLASATISNWVAFLNTLPFHIGAARGNTGNAPTPEMEKCCWKMVVFTKTAFLASTFPTIVKNSIFLWNFHQQLSKFPHNSQTFVYFVKTSENLTQVFKNFKIA